jgi:hypothetical protein
MMPHLLHFLKDNGTFLSNNHTPLIAHTANDLLTTFTGLYGDRQGMPISNSYRTFNPGGTTDPAGSFAYWTDPVFNTVATPSPGHDTNPSMVCSPVPPAARAAPASAGHDHPGVGWPYFTPVASAQNALPRRSAPRCRRSRARRNIWPRAASPGHPFRMMITGDGRDSIRSIARGHGTRGSLSTARGRTRRADQGRAWKDSGKNLQG